MGLRENDGFISLGSLPDPARVLLPDLERLLDFSYVATLSENQLRAKIGHLRTLTANGRPQSIELKGYQSIVRDHLVRALFFRSNDGLLPDLQDLRDPEYLRGYPPLRLEKLLFIIDRIILNDAHLDPDLRAAVFAVRDKVVEACAAVLGDSL